MGTGDAVSCSEASFSLPLQKLWQEVPGSRQEGSKKRWGSQGIAPFFSRVANASPALHTEVF